MPTRAPDTLPANFDFGAAPDTLPADFDFSADVKAAPPSPPLSTQQAELEMDRVLRGRPPNAPSVQVPPARRARPFYELEKPIPGTELTGLPPVRMIPPSGIEGPGRPPESPQDPASRYRSIPSVAGRAPVRPIETPAREHIGVQYDPFGARPEDGYFAATRAGLPTRPDQRPTANGMPYIGDELARSAATGALGTIQGAGRGLRIASSGGGPEGGGVGRIVGTAVEKGAGALLDLVPQQGPEAAAMVGTKTWTEDPTQLFNPYYMAKQAGMAGGSMVAFMAPFVGSLGKVSSAAGATRAAAAMSVAESLANSAEVYDDAIRSGKSEAEAADLFRKNLPKDLPFTYLTNRLGIFNERIRSPYVRAAVGTGLEGGQEVGQGMVAQHTKGEPLMQGAAENFLGGVLGGPIGAAMSPVGGARPESPQVVPQMAQVEPLAAPQPPPPAPVGMAPLEPMQAAVEAPPPQQEMAPAPEALPAPPPPPAPPIQADPEETYQRVKEIVSELPQPGTSVIAKRAGVTQDEARAMLERMTQEGLLAPKKLQSGTVVYENVERKRRLAEIKGLVRSQVEEVQQQEQQQQEAVAPAAEPPEEQPPQQRQVEEQQPQQSEPQVEEVAAQPRQEEVIAPEALWPVLDRTVSRSKDLSQSDRGMEPQVILPVDDLQVLNPIIRAIPVDVVNMLGGEKRAAEMLLHDPAVLVNRFAVSRRSNVGPDLASLALVVARRRAELRTMGDFTGRSPEVDAALEAFERNLGEAATFSTHPESASLSSSPENIQTVAPSGAEIGLPSLDLAGNSEEFSPAESADTGDLHPRTVPRLGKESTRDNQTAAKTATVPTRQERLQVQPPSVEIQAGSGRSGETALPRPGSTDTISTEAQATEQASAPLDRITAAAEAATERLRKRGIASGQTASANLFLDPKVIRDMAVSIAGDVARGVIHAKNFATAIVQRFGQGAARVARTVFRRSQRIANSQQRQPAAAPSPQAQPQQQATPGWKEFNPDDVLRSPEVRQEFEASKPQQQSLMQKAVDAGRNFVHGFTRQFPELEFGPRFANLKVRLNQMAADKSTSVHRAAQAIVDQLKPLAPAEYRTFTYAVILSDLAERIEMAKADGDPITDEELPFKIKTVADVYKLRDAAVAAAQANPKIAEAFRRREDLWNEIKPLYIDAMAALGEDVTKMLRNPKYYRHQVLKYQDMKLNDLVAKTMKKGGASGFHAPTGRGWMKHARVNALNYSTDYIQAEYEVLNDMMQDTAKAEFIDFLRDPKNGLNIAPQLMQKAREANRAAVMPHFAAVARRFNAANPTAKPMTARSAYNITMNRKQAMAMRQLEKLAAGGAFAGAPKHLQSAVKKLASRKATIVDALPVASWVMQGNASNQREAIAAGMLLKGVAQKRKLTRQLAGKKYIGNIEQAYKAFAQQSHVLWQPREGNYFYMAATIDDKLAADLMAKQVGPVDAKQIQKKLVQGAKRSQCVIPREVQATLDDYMKRPHGTWATIGKVISWPTSLWKQNVLVNPVTFVPYNLRNQVGDTWFVLEVAPHAFRYAKSAIGEIINYRRTGHWTKGSLAEQWWRRGGMGSILQVAEMGEMNQLDELKHLVEDPNNSTVEKFASAVGRALKKPWQVTRSITDTREAVLRLAIFEEFVHQMQSNNGVPKTFGASIREEVMALPDIHDRAFKLANDAMLPYNEVSHHGQAVRSIVFPFWSFTERNAVRYKRLMQNAAIDGKTAAAVGYTISGTAKIGVFTAMKVGEVALKITALKALLALYAWYKDKDEEGIPESVRKDSHILLGRDEDGKIRTFNRVVPLDDALEWFGIQSAPFFFKKYLNGQMSWEDFKKELVVHVGGVPIPVKPALQKAVQGVTPVFKYPAELLTGYSFFPDVTEPRAIRDKGAYVARELRVLWLYNKVKHLPQAKLGWNTAVDMIGVKRYDPADTYYKEFKYDKVPEWALHGKKRADSGGPRANAQSEALYNIRMSLRYEDQQALTKAVADYKQASDESGRGGSRQNIQKSIDALHPLGLLSKKERTKYVASLSPDDKWKLDQAIIFWKNNFDSKRAEVDVAASTGGLPAKKKRK